MPGQRVVRSPLGLLEVSLWIACAALVAFPPAIAYAGHTGSPPHSHVTYASGVSNPSVFYTASWNGRSFNRVWHANGWWYDGWYHRTDGTTAAYMGSYSNPTATTVTNAYAKSVCRSLDGPPLNIGSGVMFTCETNSSG